MKATLIALIASAALSSANATIYLNETFNYADGNLTNSSSGLWVTHSGASGMGVAVSEGAAVLAQGSGTRADVNRDAGAVMGAGDTWYAGFDVTVSGGSTAVYFAHFLENASTFGARAFVTAPTAGGDFAFGFSGGSSTANAFWGSDSDFDSSYRIVLSYDFDSGLTSMWVNPTDENSTFITSTGYAGDAMYGFALRQASGNSTQVIDNLVVANDFAEALTGVVVPEPGTMSLALVGALALFGLKSRRS